MAQHAFSRRYLDNRQDFLKTRLRLQLSITARETTKRERSRKYQVAQIKKRISKRISETEYLRYKVFFCTKNLYMKTFILTIKYHSRFICYDFARDHKDFKHLDEIIKDWANQIDMRKPLLKMTKNLWMMFLMINHQ